MSPVQQEAFWQGFWCAMIIVACIAVGVGVFITAVEKRAEKKLHDEGWRKP